jgi:hypothetical protein
VIATSIAPSRLSLTLLLAVSASGDCLAQLAGTKVRIFLCDTEQAALDFAVARSTPDVTDDMAGDVVNKGAGRNACNRYIGYVGKEVEQRRVVQGLLFKVTRYRLHFTDNRGAAEAWGAERLFEVAPEEQTRDL